MLASITVALSGCSASAEPDSGPPPSPSAAAPLVDDSPLEKQFSAALGANDADRVRALVDAGLDVNVNLNPVEGLHTGALELLLGLEKYDLIPVLAEFGYDLDVVVASEGDSALHEAARYGDTELMEVLVANGATVDFLNLLGRTPFHHAVHFDNFEVAEALVIYGANPALVDARGMNAADHSAKDGTQASRDWVAAFGIEPTGTE